MGVDEENLQVIDDVDVILEKFSPSYLCALQPFLHVFLLISSSSGALEN